MHSFLQSEGWIKLQERLGRNTRTLYTPSFKGFFIRYPLPFKKGYWYAPHGPGFTDATKESVNAFIEKIEELRENGAFFMRIEPRLEENTSLAHILTESGFRKTESAQPEATIVLDLTKDERTLLQEMEHDTRYAIRTAEKRGVKIERVGGLEKEKTFSIFWDLFQETNKRHDLKMYPKRYYEECAQLEGECRSELFIAWAEGVPIAGAMAVFFKDTVTYLFAGSRAGFGKWNAPTLILWHIIQHAKQEGFSSFDLWGISDEKKEWRGITAFKRSLGGKEIHFIGTWDYVFNPLWYATYTIMRKIKGMF